MTSCKYNTFSERFNAEIEIYWNGIVFSDNKYNIDGELKMNSEGGEADFTKTYENKGVKDLKFWAILGGSVLVLGALASESDKSR